MSEEQQEQTEEQQPQTEITQEDTQTEVISQKEEETEKITEETLEDKGFNYSELEQEYFNNNGELTKETTEKLNKLGFSNEFITDFINGKKAIYEQELNELSQVVGGRENYDNLITWASKNLDTDVIKITF